MFTENYAAKQALQATATTTTKCRQGAQNKRNKRILIENLTAVKLLKLWLCTGRHCDL